MKFVEKLVKKYNPPNFKNLSQQEKTDSEKQFYVPEAILLLKSIQALRNLPMFKACSQSLSSPMPSIFKVVMHFTEATVVILR